MAERTLGCLDTRPTSVAARRIGGIGRTARLAVLHATIDTYATTNVFNQQCAFLLDRALRADGSS